MMSGHLLLQGILIGVVVAVPLGPLGLLCINRALMSGAVCGLFSGLGVATADALAAGIAALGISFVSSFLLEHQFYLRLAGGIFLCYLGLTIFRARIAEQPPPASVSGLLNAYFTTFLLTASNPVTILSFIAIYAGWHVQNLAGRYFAAATLTFGVFIGSSLWWVALFIGMTVCQDKFNLAMLGWVQRISGALIAAFGMIVLLSLSPLRSVLGLEF